LRKNALTVLISDFSDLLVTSPVISISAVLSTLICAPSDGRQLLEETIRFDADALTLRCATFSRIIEKMSDPFFSGELSLSLSSLHLSSSE
jgi:hypothetical protein